MKKVLHLHLDLDPASGLTVGITADNATTVASDVLSAVNFNVAFGASFVSAFSNTSSPSKHFDIVNFLENQVALIAGSMKGKATALNRSASSTITNTNPCPQGGSVTITINDNDNNGGLSAGDTFSEQFQNCQETDGAIFNGTISAQVSLVEGDIVNKVSPYNAQFIFNFSNLGLVINSDSVTTNGDMTLVFRNQDGVNSFIDVSGGTLKEEFTGTRPDIDTLSDYSFNSSDNLSTTQYSFTAKSMLDSTVIGGSVSLQTSQPFQGMGDANPNQGVMVINGAQGSNETATAIDNVNVQLAVDANGDGVAEQTIQTTWSQLACGC